LWAGRFRERRREQQRRHIHSERRQLAVCGLLVLALHKLGRVRLARALRGPTEGYAAVRWTHTAFKLSDALIKRITASYELAHYILELKRAFYKLLHFIFNQQRAFYKLLYFFLEL
jgi:hypothetical protein